MLIRPMTVLCFVLTSASVIAQETNVGKGRTRIVSEEVEAVLSESKAVDDKTDSIAVRAKGAQLTSFFDRAKSDALFVSLWTYVKEQPDKDFDKEQAFNIILRLLFPRNPALAKRLLSERPAAQRKSLGDVDSNLQQRFTLASQLMDMDPAQASGILEQSLALGVTPLAMNAVNKLNEKDPLLAQVVVAKAVNNLRSQPSVVSLNGLYLLASFVFSANSDAGDFSAQWLQFQYVSTAFEVLTMSLKESTEVLVKQQHYSESDLRLRAAFQAQVANLLAAVAPRYQPASVNELRSISLSLDSQIPPSLRDLNRFNVARLSGSPVTGSNPDLAIPLAISSGDFEEANRLIDAVKDDEAKKRYQQLQYRAQAKALLGKSDFMGAVSFIRKIEDRNAQLGYYLTAIVAAEKKRDPEVTALLVNEARTLVPKVERNGLHVRLLLSFVPVLAKTSYDDAAEFLSDAVSGLNSLGGISSPEGAQKSGASAALAELNNPHSFLESQELEKAFSLAGVLDLDRTLVEARRIEFRPLQLMARLVAVERVAQDEWTKSKLKAPTTSRPMSPK